MHDEARPAPRSPARTARRSTRSARCAAPAPGWRSPAGHPEVLPARAARRAGAHRPAAMPHRQQHHRQDDCQPGQRDRRDRDAQADANGSAATSSGATVKPAALAPFSARLIARPRRRSNHKRPVVAMVTVVVPAQPAAIGTTQTNICHGAVTWLSSIGAHAEAHGTPPPSTIRGPSSSIARCTRVISAGAGQVETGRRAGDQPAGQPCSRCNSAR